MQYNFYVDERTMKRMTTLQKTFGAANNSSVIKKSLALAYIASKHADKDNTIIITGKDGVSVKVLLAK